MTDQMFCLFRKGSWTDRQPWPSTLLFAGDRLKSLYMLLFFDHYSARWENDPCLVWPSGKREDVGVSIKASISFAFKCQREKPLDAQRQRRTKTSLHKSTLSQHPLEVLTHNKQRWRTEMQKQTQSYLITKMLISRFCLWQGTSGWLAWALRRVNKLFVCWSVLLCRPLHLKWQVSLAGRQRKDGDLCDFTLTWGWERRQIIEEM